MDWMSLSALTVMVLFYGTYFGKQLLLRSRGIQVNRLGKGGKPARTLLVERFLKLFTLLIVPVELASLILYPRFAVIKSVPIRGIGVLLSFAGVIMFLLAVCHMRDSWRAGVDSTQSTRLVTNGIYRISRNPAFVGFDLIYLGILLVSFNWVHLLTAVSVILLMHLQILEEEDYLEKTFAGEYRVYRKKVRRYL